MLDRRQAAYPCLCTSCTLSRMGSARRVQFALINASNDGFASGGPAAESSRLEATGAGPYPGQRDDGTGLPPLHHIGMVVRDCEKTLANLGAGLGFGPAFRFEGDFPDAVLASGERGLSLKGAFISMRNTALEIVEPVDDRSPHAQFLKERGEGLHHLAYWVDSVESEIAAMARNGVAPTMLVDGTGPENAVPWCYLEGDMAGTAIVELIERNAASEQVYAEIFTAIGGRIPV